MLPDVSKLEPLPGPYDILELQSGQSITLKPTGFVLGTMSIKPKGATESKTIIVLRLTVDRADKSTSPPYWDITSQLLIADLHAHLSASLGAKTVYQVRKQGTGPQARFTTTINATR